MSSAASLWWLALPLLLLPLWWHRQKRRRLQAQPLATARFLPSAAPQQQRVWRWVERLLLWLRCLLLLAVIAWLADVAVAWRGDTVLLGPKLDPAWAEAQIQQAGMAQARRLPFCAETDPDRDPDRDSTCTARTDDILRWLHGHEREWRADARLLLVARGADVPMPQQAPVLAHPLTLRLQPAPAPTPPVQRHVVLVSERAAAWRALFAAFEAAGLGHERYVWGTEPNPQTELVIWDQPQPPPTAWRAPLWWVGEAAAWPELAGARRLQIQGLHNQGSQDPAWQTLRWADSPRGRLWALDSWPLQDIEGARVLFQSWQTLQRAPLPYPPPALTLAASATPPALLPVAALQAWLAPLLVVLFALERLLAHARRS